MLRKTVLALVLILSLALTVTTFAQEATPVPSASLEANNLYLVEYQWGGADAEWNPGGLWVLGSREGQPIVALTLASMDEGATLEGEIVYAGEGPIAFRGTQESPNVYVTEVQWGGADAAWNPNGVWVIGARDGQPIVNATLTAAEDGSLTGEVTYAGEGPIGFRGMPVDGAVYYTQNQWGGADAEWNPGGVWVIGNRPGQPVASLTAASADEGMTFEGEMVYAGEGPIGFRATHLLGSAYTVENQWGGADAAWNPGGYFILGGRGEQKVVALDLVAGEEALEGTITYAGEGPIGFHGVPLNAHNVALAEAPAQ